MISPNNVGENEAATYTVTITNTGWGKIKIAKITSPSFTAITSVVCPANWHIDPLSSTTCVANNAGHYLKPTKKLNITFTATSPILSECANQNFNVASTFNQGSPSTVTSSVPVYVCTENEITVDITSPEKNKLYNINTIPLNFDITGEVDSCNYTLDSDPEVIVGCDGTGDMLSSLSEGQHTVIVYAKDNADTEGSDSSTFTVDTMPPVVQILFPTEGYVFNTDSTVVNYTITDTNGLGACSYTLDSEPTQAMANCGDPILLTGLTGGSHSLVLNATDAAGNPGSDSVTFSVNSDYFVRPCGAEMDLCTWDAFLPLGSPDNSGCNLQYNTLWPAATSRSVICQFDGSQFAEHTFYFSVDNDVVNCTLNGQLLVDLTQHEGCAPQDPRNGYVVPITTVAGTNSIVCNIRDRHVQSFFDACVVGEGEPVPPCNPETEMITNGGFELPALASGQWNIFDSGTSGLGWGVQWMSPPGTTYNRVTIPTVAKLELQNRVSGWLSADGVQMAELDGDWDGPSGSLGGEPASVKISQALSTVPGRNYTLTYYFSPRPNTGVSENVLRMSVNGVPVQTWTVAGSSGTNWVQHSYTFIAESSTTTVEFADLGTSNSIGTFLDAVSMKCNEPPYVPFCGNGICDANENPETCSLDCHVTDDNAPTVNITAPANGQVIGIHDVNVSSIIADDVGLHNCWYILGGSSAVPTVCGQLIQLNLADGAYTLALYANDTSGNQNHANVAFTVDTSVPDVPSPPSGPSNNGGGPTYIPPRRVITTTSVNETPVPQPEQPPVQEPAEVELVKPLESQPVLSTPEPAPQEVAPPATTAALFGLDLWSLWPACLIALLILLLLLLLFARKKCKACKKMNMPWAKKCSKCGELFKSAAKKGQIDFPPA